MKRRDLRVSALITTYVAERLLMAPDEESVEREELALVQVIRIRREA
jgi:hypothetical protein